MIRSMITLIAVWFAVGVAVAQDNVLIVVSSAGSPENPEQGYEFDELAQAYWTFVDNGLQVQIASPAGGEPISEGVSPLWAFNKRFQDDPQAMAKLADTIELADVDADDYDAVFVVGGTGAALDLADDARLQALLVEVYRDGGVLGAVCHGPAAWVNIEVDGRPLLAQRRATAFTNDEQALFGEGKHELWSLQDRMSELGAEFVAAAPLQLNVVSDGKLVSGQNPFSTARTAEAVLRAMGRMPESRRPYRSENTVELIRLVSEGDQDEAAQRLQANPQDFEAMFLALLGVRQMETAGNAPERVQEALALMTLSQPYFQHERLSLALATAHQQLGRVDEAKRILQDWLAEHPDSEKAKASLAAMAAQ